MGWNLDTRSFGSDYTRFVYDFAFRFVSLDSELRLFFIGAFSHPHLISFHLKLDLAH